MKVRFTPEQEAQILRIATYAGMDTEHFVKKAALRVVEEKARFSAAVREGIGRPTVATLLKMMTYASGWSSKNSALDAHTLDAVGLSIYIVAYRVTQSEAVQILRIWHGAQGRQ